MPHSTPFPQPFPDHRFRIASSLIAEPSLETMIAAALACTGEADFRRRLGNPPAGTVGFDHRTDP